MFVNLETDSGIVDTGNVDDSVWQSSGNAILAYASQVGLYTSTSTTGAGLYVGRNIHSWGDAQAWIADVAQREGLTGATRGGGTSPTTDPKQVAIASAQTSIDDGDGYLAKGDFAGAVSAYQSAGQTLSAIPSSSVGAQELALQSITPVSMGDAIKAQSIVKAMIAQVQKENPPAGATASPWPTILGVGLGAAALAGGAWLVWRWTR